MREAPIDPSKVFGRLCHHQQEAAIVLPLWPGDTVLSARLTRGTGGGGSAGGGNPTADRPVPSPARAGTPGPPGRPHAPGTGAGQRSQLGKAPARSPCGRQQRRSPGRQRKPQQSQACPRFRLVRRWEWTVSVRPALLSGATSLPAREVEADTGPRPGQRGGGVEGEGGSRLRNPGKLV